ncbi:TetR/AcrR family transcriptional regulator [Gordonia phosphorivorans]|uniref:TetR/AcrR family transcriptional regulator n=1 Tax=Gordonia phosphorivorans TaxID=1056982 RepID=A0ABV6HCK2_9ACTN
MATPPRPAGAARAAVNAAAILTREIEQRLLAPAVDAVASDGRKQRWARHKQARRTELILGTMEAVRALGPEAGMDEIAAHVGVSKTVLYRYFTDKNDLAAAVSEAFIQTTLLPGLTEALTEELDDFELVRAVIGVYVRTVAQNPNLYRYSVTTEHSDPGMLAAAVRVFAGAIESTLHSRLTDREAETSGAATWALVMIGGVELTVGRWLDAPWVDADQLTDELTMLLWGGVAGVIQAGGSASDFVAAPPRISPILNEE